MNKIILESDLKFQRGSIFLLDNIPYILAQLGGNRFHLICLLDGNRFGDEITCNNNINITEKEFKTLTSEHPFRLYKGKLTLIID